MSLEFYRCAHCGNIIQMVHNAGVPVMCCGQKMDKLTPNTVEASNEKHIPAVTVDGAVVCAKVGEVTHPMVPEHFIGWICLETEKGSQLCRLQPGEAPEARFTVAEGDKPVAVYAYCNLHGLWKADL